MSKLHMPDNDCSYCEEKDERIAELEETIEKLEALISKGFQNLKRTDITDALTDVDDPARAFMWTEITSG